MALIAEQHGYSIENGGRRLRELFEELSQSKSIKIIDLGVPEWLDSIELIWEEKHEADEKNKFDYTFQKFTKK